MLRLLDIKTESLSEPPSFNPWKLILRLFKVMKEAVLSFEEKVNTTFSYLLSNWQQVLKSILRLTRKILVLTISVYDYSDLTEFCCLYLS